MHKKSNQIGNYNEENIAVISELVSIIENATLRYKTSDNKGRNDVIAIYKLIGSININDEVRRVEILIREIYHAEYQENRFHFYNHVLL